MTESKKVEWLLECLVHVIGRAGVKMDEVREIVGAGAKQIEAYNLCDGSRTLTSVAKKAQLDAGSLSRSVDRWVKNGVMFRFEEGREVRLLHIFPVPTNAGRSRKPRKRTRR